MSLVRCPECGKENVSDSALICPNCSFQIKKHFDKIKKERLLAEERQKKLEENEIELNKTMDKLNQEKKPYKPTLYQCFTENRGWLIAFCVLFSIICIVGFVVGLINDENHPGSILIPAVLFGVVGFGGISQIKKNYEWQVERYEQWDEIKKRDIEETKKRYAVYRDNIEKYGDRNGPSTASQTIPSYTVYDSSLPRCPRCGSTAISTGARGVNHFWGFIGASKTVNRCAKCGHMWEPKG